MSNDPRYPGDEDAEGNKKTRLIMRPDVAEAGASPDAGAQPRGGSVIGTTRLTSQRSLTKAFMAASTQVCNGSSAPRPIVVVA